MDQLREKSGNSEKQLVEIEDRYHSIKRICRSHNVELDQIFNLQSSLEEELKSIRDVDEKIIEIEKEILLINDRYKKETAFLSNERYKFAAKLDKKIEKELKPLKLELAKFKTEIIRVQESKFGCDHVCFTTEINPGSGFKPLNKIASGGELSRFLLAAKLCLFGEDNKKTQIFDEIDRGVGGATASAIGKRLLELSKHEQVLVVTHSPQVASKAHKHWNVSKKITSEGFPLSSIKELGIDDIKKELARMISGKIITKEAIAAAEKLMP